MSRQIYRYMIPTDHEEHDFLLSGPIRAVASRVPNNVEFWAEHDDDVEPVNRRLFIAGTGRILPEQAVYRGHTFDALDRGLVWHLMEVCSKHRQSHPADGHPGSCPVCWPHA